MNRTLAAVVVFACMAVVLSLGFNSEPNSYASPYAGALGSNEEWLDEAACPNQGCVAPTGTLQCSKRGGVDGYRCRMSASGQCSDRRC